MATITETCGCGATITATDGSMPMVGLMVKRWREGHQHAESVGICGGAHWQQAPTETPDHPQEESA